MNDLRDCLANIRTVNDAAILAPRLAEAAGVSQADALEFIRRKRGIHATLEDVRRMRNHVPTWSTRIRSDRWQKRHENTHGHLPNMDLMARGRF
jgi:hypothetical protein